MLKKLDGGRKRIDDEDGLLKSSERKIRRGRRGIVWRGVLEGTLNSSKERTGNL